MKRILSLVMCLTLFVGLCSACGNSQKDVYEQNAEQADAGAGTEDGRSADETDENGKADVAEDGSEAGNEMADSGEQAEPEQKELSGELTIATMFDFTVKTVAEEFMALHPNVTVQVEANPEMIWTDYSKKLTVELMSGEMEADLVEAGWFDFHKAGRNGLLCDLYEYMDADEDFHREDYFENVFNAMETGENLYAVPYSFAPDAVFLSKKVTDVLEANMNEYQSVNYNQLIELYNRADELGALAEDFYLDEGGNNRTPWSYEMETYYDHKNGTVNFDSPEAIKFLETTKKLRRSADNGENYQMMGYSGMTFPKVEDCFVVHQKISADKIQLLQMETEEWNHLIPLTTAKGQQKFRCYPYAIPTISDQKELAWEFLKYWMGERDDVKHGDPFMGLIPIGRTNCRSLAEFYCKPHMDEELYAKYLKVAESADSYLPTTADLRNDIWWSITNEYYMTGTISAEECLKQLQERTEMYLKE